MPEYRVAVDLVDAYERSARKEFYTVSTMADHASAVAAAASLMSDLANLTELRILSYTVGERTVYTDTVDAGANKDEGVTLTMRKSNNYKDSIKVPGPINAIFNADGTVDLTDAAVTAFVANFLTGGDFTFSDGEQATELVKGVLDK